MDGFEIILTTDNRNWTGSPDFVRAVAAYLAVDKFESLRIYREAPATTELRPTPEQEREKLLEVKGPSVEAAIGLQRADEHCTTVMHFGSTAMIDALAQEIAATLPETLSEGWTPIEGSLYNGPWKHYDYSSGELTMDSGCCLILGNRLGYPVDLDAYLAAFLKLPTVIRLRQRLEEASGLSWRALIDLT